MSNSAHYVHTHKQHTSLHMHAVRACIDMHTHVQFPYAVFEVGVCS